MSADGDGFDDLIDRFSRNIRQIEALIDRAPATERPVIERKLTDVLREVSHLRPLGDRSDTLHEPASRDGIYTAPNLVAAQRDRLEDAGLKTRVTEAVQGTGIDGDAVLARMREGAGNAALEQHWLAQDLRAIAAEERLDLRDDAQRAQAMDRLEAVHGKLGEVLAEARVLRVVAAVEREGPEREDGADRSGAVLRQREGWSGRAPELAENPPAQDRADPADPNLSANAADVFDPSERQAFRQLVAQFRHTDFDHPFSDDSTVRRAGAVEVAAARAAFEAFAQRFSDHAELASMAWERITDSRTPPSHVAPADRRLHPGDMDLALRDPSDHLGPITEDMRTLARYRAEMPEDALRAGMEREIAWLRAEGASRADISERGFEIEDGVRQAYADRRHLEASAPDLAVALQQAVDGRVEMATDTAQRRFVEQINERLMPDERAGLRAGDAEALHRITRDSRAQLELARAYLEADKVHANDPAMDKLLDRIADLRHGDDLRASTDGDRGMRHG